jgi:hypothetical protein
MSSATSSLDRIKVQTARMVEMYGLLQREIANSEALSVPPEEQQLLRQAIGTIETNMRQIQAYFAQYQEENSPVSAEARELEEIVNAVLEWCTSHNKGE